MIALCRLRLAGFVRTGRALAPLLAGIAALAILYGGGQPRVAEAYGVSALILFPVLAWQSAVLLDAEPDGQRRLALVAVGGLRREVGAGLLAAAVAGLGLIVLALAFPWLIQALDTASGVGSGLLLGVLAHLLALPPAVALGALASRAVTRSAATRVTVLVTGSVLAIVLGLSGSSVPWLVPPVMSVARTLSGDQVATAALVVAAVRALVWAAAAVAGYLWLRRRRA